MRTSGDVEQLAVSQLAVDTDIIIDYLRRRTEALKAALLHYECAMTAISLYELKAVAVRSPRQEALIEELCSVVDVLPFDDYAAEFAADVWRTLRSEGRMIGLPDTLIAGTCLAHDLPLLTRNVEHYERVADLIVVTADDIPSVSDS